ncbi:MAG: STAS domain-containing protein, partial [Jatrophihabitantaceae bacterium]
MSAFAIESAFVGDSYELRLSGAVDLLVTDTVIEAALARIADPAVPRLVIDLRAVTFLDSTGLGALVTIRNATVAMDKQLALR